MSQPINRTPASVIHREALFRLLKEYEVSDKRVARIWGVERSTVSKMRSGRLNLTPERIQAACDALGVGEEEYQACYQAVERERLHARVSGIRPPASSTDVAQVLASLHAVRDLYHRGEIPQAHEFLDRLQTELSGLGELDLPWFHFHAGYLLIQEKPALAARAFKIAAEGLFRYWLAAKYEEGRSYMRQACREADSQAAARLRQQAKTAFNEAQLFPGPDARTHADICREYAELIRTSPEFAEDPGLARELNEAAIRSYQKAFDQRDPQDLPYRADCLLNIGVCRWRLDEPEVAVSKCLSALEIQDNEVEIAYIVKYLALAHYDLAGQVAGGVINRFEHQHHYALAGWCAEAAVRIYDRFRRRIGYTPQGTQVAWADAEDARKVRSMIFDVNPQLANQYIPDLPESSRISRRQVYEAYLALCRRDLGPGREGK